jgi:hypothetical protein
VLWDFGKKVVRQFGPAGDAGDILRLPTENVFEEPPRISERRALEIAVEEFLDRLGLDRRLMRRCKVILADDVGADDEADRPDMVEPFKLRIGGGVEHHVHDCLGHR